MTYYKLRKDTPTAKAGTKFKADVRGYDSRGLLARLVPLDTSADLQWKIRDIDNFDEWFEEIQEPADSAHWKPKKDDEYFYIDDDGQIFSDLWLGTAWDGMRLELDNVYPTEEECKKAKERKLAEARLRQTSNFKPDPKNGNGGYVVYYDHRCNSICYCNDFFWCNIGVPIHYASVEEVEKSIKKNKKEWLTYFGVEDD